MNTNDNTQEKWSFKKWWKGLFGNKETEDENEELVDEQQEQQLQEDRPKKSLWWLWLLIAVALLAVLAIVFWPSDDKKTDGNGGTEQVDPTPSPNPNPNPNPAPNPAPAPLVQIEIPVSAITGEYQWSNIPASKQSQLIETDSPDLQGEKILLAHKVKGLPSGKTLIWIQTETADGSVRNILTDESHVTLK